MSGNWVSYIKRHGKPAMGSWHEDGVLKLYTAGEGQKDAHRKLGAEGRGLRGEGKTCKIGLRKSTKVA